MFIANPHVYTLEDGTRHKSTGADQLGMKAEADPYGLLNPGKMRTYQPVKKLTVRVPSIDLSAIPLPESPSTPRSAREALAGLKEAGHTVDLCDLYAEKFDPVMWAESGATITTCRRTSRASPTTCAACARPTR